MSKRKTGLATSALYKKCKAKKFKPEHVAEVGVYLPETSNVVDFIYEGVKTTLVEADPKILEKINERFGVLKNVTVHPHAIYDRSGTLALCQRGASTFIADIVSPALVNDSYILDEADKFEVQAITFDQIDEGSIDLLSIDIEGAEWYALKHMVSRPKVISVETHGKYYINPFLSEILTWMTRNGYVLWYKDSSDSVFIKSGTFPISFIDKVALFFTELYLFVRRSKKFLR